MARGILGRYGRLLTLLAGLWFLGCRSAFSQEEWHTEEAAKLGYVFEKHFLRDAVYLLDEVCLLDEGLPEARSGFRTVADP